MELAPRRHEKDQTLVDYHLAYIIRVVSYNANNQKISQTVHCHIRNVCSLDWNGLLWGCLVNYNHW